MLSGYKKLIMTWYRGSIIVETFFFLLKKYKEKKNQSNHMLWSKYNGGITIEQQHTYLDGKDAHVLHKLNTTTLFVV